ncbi:MAG: hypothetical protein Ct9H90mP17_1460 [Actinomycetota bacterium]|nr:MAG: hypothetical protein Ct9H90mP17_1460 [Actinomycetota bacterium]
MRVTFADAYSSLLFTDTDINFVEFSLFSTCPTIALNSFSTISPFLSAIFLKVSNALLNESSSRLIFKLSRASLNPARPECFPKIIFASCPTESGTLFRKL